MNLAGRTVIVTGASGGIGVALCQALVHAGASILAVGRSRSRLTALAAGLPMGRVHTVVADLSTSLGRSHLLAAIRQADASPSVLVLGHAQSAFGLFEDQHPDALEHLLQTNLVGSALLIHALLPVLRRHEQASVVAIGSTFGSIGFAGFATYSASKFGLRGLMEALAREHDGTGLSFQYLSPRATRTAFNTPAVDALNAELKVGSDAPEAVARALVHAIGQGDRRRQLGWPEKLFARINGMFPALVDRSLRAQLPIIRRHASQAQPIHEDSSHEATSR
ncbi:MULTISPECIES: SDR family oxidoreductase [unclassified Stenotrophomonas]|uniref:SDR family oxidoreductase n=1 Tax=unclassified Stenotrophomonas TaxID=196198 RepID=UPI0021C5909B|nr:MULTISPECIES: SDR family oxidoreductase [unclassified Stenotrophomonas]